MADSSARAGGGRNAPHEEHATLPLAAADSPRFAGSERPTVGLELELAVLDPDTAQLSPGSPRILAACREEGVEGVTAELMQSMIEVRSGSPARGCADIGEVSRHIFERVNRVRNIAHSLGYELALLATHPSSRPNENVLYPDERYGQAIDRAAWMVYHRVTFGQHVHVRVRSGDEAVRLIDRFVHYLPHLLALSANSPFWQGIDTGLASSRAVLYGLVPHGGIPPHFPTWRDFQAYCQTMHDCRVLHSHKDVKWDIRPSAGLGTIEFRICDMPPSIGIALALAALVRSLVIEAQRELEEAPPPHCGDERLRWIAAENKWLAARHGLAATFIFAPDGRRRALRQEVGELVDRLLPIARELGDERFLEPLRPVEQLEPGAERQRRLYREAGTWHALVEDSIARLAQELGEREDRGG